MRSRRIAIRRAVMVVVLAAALTAVTAIGICAWYASRFMPGVSINGIAIEGLTRAEARDKLSERLSGIASNARLNENGSVQNVPLAVMGVAVPLEDALDDAFVLGHGGAWWESLRAFAMRDGQERSVLLGIEYDRAILDAFLRDRYAGGLEQAARSATVSFDGARVQVTPSREGVIVDRDRLMIDLGERFYSFSEDPVTLYGIADLPRVTTDEAETLAKKIESSLSVAPYFLYGNGKRFVITRAQIAEWMTVTSEPDAVSMSISAEGIDAYLLAIAPAVRRQARDVELWSERAGDEARVRMPSTDALQLNVTSTRALLAEEIMASRRTIDAAVDATPAQINERYLEERGIRQLLGRGVSNFVGSSRSRIQNIRVATEKYRGLFIDAGAQFTFNAHLGEIDEKSGFVPELVIKSGKLLKEYGGGVCQVSTTFFRAAVWAGLKVTERANHSIPVSYYGKPGFDATVYPPSPDLKFVNSTSGTIFIQPRIEGTLLTFDIYGTHDGRIVTVEGPKTYSSSPDGSLKTMVVQTVTRGTDVILKKTFWSFYKPAAKYAVERNPLE